MTQLEWMASVDSTTVAGMDSEELLDRFLDAAKGGPIEGAAAIIDGDTVAVGSTFTVWAVDEAAAAAQGREIFTEALRGAAIDATVAAVEVGTYDEAPR